MRFFFLLKKKKKKEENGCCQVGFSLFSVAGGFSSVALCRPQKENERESEKRKKRRSPGDFFSSRSEKASPSTTNDETENK